MASILSVGELRGLNENGNVVTVPSGHMFKASGHTVQTQIGFFDGEVTATGAALIPTGCKVSITPKFAASNFLVMSQGPLNARPAAYGCGVMLYARNLTTSGTMQPWGRNNDSTILITGGSMYDNATGDLWASYTVFGYQAAPAYSLGETLEWEVYFGSTGPGSDGSTTARFGHTDFQNQIIVQEIAQ